MNTNLQHDFKPDGPRGCSSSGATLRFGRVVAIRDKGVWIDLDPEVSCGACQTQSLCAQRGRRQHFVPIDEPENLGIGSAIELEIRDASLNRAVWLAYGVPLLSCLGVTAAVTRLMPGNEIAAVGAAVIGLAIGFGLLFAVSRRETAPTLQIRLRRRD